MIDEDDIVLQPTEVHFLRMNVPPVRNPNPIGGVTLEQLHRPIDPGYYLDLYQEVGLRFNWVDRLLLPREELEVLINSEDTLIFLLFFDGQPCGFTELVWRIHFIEILYFGLFPEFVGKGLGAPCLRATVNEAWSREPEWIELNTCKLDHPRALDLYEKAGFAIYTTRTEMRRRFH